MRGSFPAPVALGHTGALRLVQSPGAPGGLYRMGNTFVRGGRPWSSIPADIESPRFREWAKGWVEHPLLGDHLD